MPRLIHEITIDWDFNKHNPCLLAIRIQKLIHFLKLYNIPHIITLTGQGIHVKIYVNNTSKTTHLIVRSCFNDDYTRLNLDYHRVLSNAKIWNILFTWRHKKYSQIKKSREKIIHEKEIEQIIDTLINKCHESCL